MSKNKVTQEQIAKLIAEAKSMSPPFRKNVPS